MENPNKLVTQYRGGKTSHVSICIRSVAVRNLKDIFLLFCIQTETYVNSFHVILTLCYDFPFFLNAYINISIFSKKLDFISFIFKVGIK